MRNITLLILLCFFTVYISCAQSAGTAALQKAIDENSITLATKLLHEYTNALQSGGNYDSLVSCVFYVGKVEELRVDAEAAVKKVQAFLAKITSLTSNPLTLGQAYIEAGEYYGSVGKNKLGYAANQQAYLFSKKITGLKPAQLALIESNLGTCAQRMGDIDLSKQHNRRALQLYLSEAMPNYEQLYIINNNMGSIMYYASKTDSALYFFTKSLQALAKTPRTPVNQYYRPAILQNNLSGLYSTQGKITEAINAMKSTINDLRSFLATKEPNTKKVTATTFQFEATDNLAGIYKELGDLKQARDLLEYSYRQKQQLLDAKDPAIFISKILLGQLYYALNEFDKAEVFLLDGNSMISKSDGDYLFWQADACNTLALLYDKRKNIPIATRYYLMADSLYEKSLQGEYDNIYLEFLRNASLFYAQNKVSQTAIAKANKGYQYIVKTQGTETLETFYQLLNLSGIYFELQQYTAALKYSNLALSTVNKITANSDNLLDSIKIELKKPKAILYRAKAQYALLKKKDEASLTSLLHGLNQALIVVDRQKSILTDAQDITLLMADQHELLEFIKKITLELYSLTGQQGYIDKIMSLQESGIYNRIRSRLDKNDTLQFINVPVAVIGNEKKLKAAIAASLQGNDSYQQKMQAYFAAVTNWNKFLNSLKVDYPAYFKLRYASIVKPLNQLQKAIDADKTIVRYFFADKNLYALVATATQKKIVALKAPEVVDNIALLSNTTLQPAQVGKALHLLYKQLWAPLQQLVTTKRVVIIPDGVLYSLNFDLLTPQPINNYKELAQKSLLARHSFSYHYSLFLVDEKKEENYKSRFVAFAPGFSDDSKSIYQTAKTDPLNKDVQYMSLLPQPFTLQLASKIQQLLGGTLYKNNQSTKTTFEANAGNHQIIHIGTHAESNNDHPQYSKLIFARGDDVGRENELFVHEIYNCNLNAALAVLTACETGKPGYQDGEGMISLAHAFNYAGSKSIVTGLWKIDEQASAILIEKFYNNLLKGLTKDEALRQAKIVYLQQNEGRMLAPQYWAGLVIMGNTSPVIIKQPVHWIRWALVVALLIAGGVILVGFQKTSQKSKA